MHHRSQSARIGIVGTGFVGRGLAMLIEKVMDAQLSRVLTRRPVSQVADFPRPEVLTNALDDLIEHSDLVVECSGDVLFATQVVDQVLKAGLPVVTMDCEFHVTTGSYFVGRGLLTEAEGDQPGVLAMLKEEATSMGFEPIAYGNIKGFLNLNPTPEDMQYWSEKLNTRLHQIVQFTDGTKLQIEQALVANGLDADIVTEGMLGPRVQTLEEGAQILGEAALLRERAISDYVVFGGGPPGVFLLGKHDDGQKKHLHSYKMGDGAFHTLLRPYHLCHFEIPRTIRRTLDGQGPLLDNTAKPRAGVAAVAKKALPAGQYIERGIGSFDFRGTTVNIAERSNHVPIGLLSGAVLRNSVEPGQILTFADVDLPESLALACYKEILERVLDLQAQAPVVPAANVVAPVAAD